VYVAETGQPGGVRRVAVLLDWQRRQALAGDIARHLVAPALVFLPLLALVLAWAIRRGLRPLKGLSADIQALNVDAGQSLTLKQPYKELGVVVKAINQLVQRLASQVQRERRFAADVAHELRTPLTSLVLQARRARNNPVALEQAQALAAVEQGAMRAGRILSQLLDLARAQSLADDLSESVDLCALAHRVVSEHAALAHALGQEIALEAPEQALRVPGRTTLLELALRNLVDNALRHNPTGTYVEVRVATDAEGRTVLSVSDDGVDALHRESAASSETLAVRGMGIGLTLVERIAQSQCVQLVRDGAAAPFSKRYALVWENPARPEHPG
jgi:two-component system sensor histidine kinase QseC